MSGDFWKVYSRSISGFVRISRTCFFFLVVKWGEKEVCVVIFCFRGIRFIFIFLCGLVRIEFR